MNIAKYLDIPYDHNNVRGVNCWGLNRMVYRDELGIELKAFQSASGLKAAVAKEFKKHLDDCDHGLAEVEGGPKNYDTIVFHESNKRGERYHCGVWWNGKVLHANGEGRKGSVWHDKLKDIPHDTMRVFRHAGA